LRGESLGFARATPGPAALNNVILSERSERRILLSSLPFRGCFITPSPSMGEGRGEGE